MTSQGVRLRLLFTSKDQLEIYILVNNRPLCKIIVYYVETGSNILLKCSNIMQLFVQLIIF